MSRALFFDFETTGLTFHPEADPDLQPRIIEYGAALVDLDSLEVVATSSQIIDPGVTISDEITKITGITNADFDGQPILLGFVETMMADFVSADVLVAHNLPFDKAVLTHELRRLARAGAPKWAENWPWPARDVCTAAAYAPLWGRQPKLLELYQFAMGRELAQTHRALDDVLAMVEACRALGFEVLR